MKILVTNDDGIYAPGLWALAEELSRKAEVVVVAPDREQSAVGTSITLHQPLRVKPVRPPISGIETYAVEGTPGDSVILALGTLVQDGVGLVVSGINEGSNLGNDVLISGTVGAAFQGYFRGLSTIAISVTAIENVQFYAAARFARLLAQRFASGALPQGLFLNVNLPNLPLEEIQGVEITRLARRTYEEAIKEGHDGKRKYYWIVRGKSEWNEEPGTDIWAIRQNKVSITPLGSNLACSLQEPYLHTLGEGLFGELLQAVS